VISSNHNCHFLMKSNRLHCKSSCNQWLLSRLHKMFDYLTCLVCKANVNNRANLPIDRLLSYLYLSVYLFYEHKRKMCWNTASDVAAIISHINRHFRLTRVVFTRLSQHTASNHAWLLCDTVVLNSAVNDSDWPAIG